MPRPLGAVEPTESWDSQFATTEHSAALAQAAVATRLGVELDAVNIRMADTPEGIKIVGATVYLSADEVLRFSRP